MPTLLSARSRRTRAGGDDDGGAGNCTCYGITACAVALLLFCALAASGSVWMAFAFGAAGCLAPASWRVVGPSDGGASAGIYATVDTAGADAAATARARRRFGMPKAAIDALPTFVYELKGGEVAGGGSLCCTDTPA
ncbi:unnamed protein product [Urochloa humidicola]